MDRSDANETPPVTTILDLFAAQVARTPHRIAVEDRGTVVTYAALDEQTNRFASVLRARGVVTDSCVGVHLERSMAQIVAVIGVMKAGAAYTPLDPTYPEERLRRMARATPIVVTQTSLADVALSTQQIVIASPALPGAAALLKDTDVAAADTPRPVVIADNLAYVVFTSGSTGTPKGVAMPHGALANLIAWQVAATPIARRTLQWSALSFDVSLQEMFSTWCSGGTLVVLDEPTRRDPLRLLDFVKRERIERMFMQYVALQHLAEAASVPAAAETQLCEVFVAGEQLVATEAIRAWFAPTPERPAPRLFNQYGPSENHVVTSHALGSVSSAWPTLPPIGALITNARGHISDGELFIGGLAVARGYLGRPDLTAERFVPDPSVPGGRMYRTGDQCQWRPDGEIEFLGRVDQQVKVRGYRVELGEIEMVFAGHASVLACAVTARETHGGKQLVAYLVPRTPLEAGDIGALRERAKALLPEYMVPAAIVVLPRFPLTPSGKVDRAALPAPGEADFERATYAAPRSTVEIVVAKIWADVLGRARIGRDDDFFALGGHSLVATRIMARIHEQLAIALPLRALFDAPTVARLAEAIAAAPVAVIPAQRPRLAAPPLSLAQERLWFLHTLDPNSAVYNVPSYHRLVGPLDLAALQRAFATLVERHTVLRTVIRIEEGVAVQHVLAPGTWSLRISDGALDVEAEQRAPFDLANGPLFRALLVRLGDDDHALLVTGHHIILDRWSLDVMWRELAIAYAGGTLPPLPAQFADHAWAERERLTPPILAAELAYWRQQLDAAPPHTELPVKGARPPIQTDHGASIARDLDPAIYARLEALARQHRTSPFVALLAALRVVLVRYTGQHDLCIGTTVANRDQLETDHAIGFFISTVALRTPLDGTMTYRDVLERERDTLLEAHAHRDAPFDMVVRAVEARRDPSRNPIFQVDFAHDMAPPETCALRGLRALPLATRTIAMFDLSVRTEWHGDQLGIVFEYNTDLFAERTIDAMSAAFATLLAAVAADPDREIAALPLLSPGEQRAIIAALGADDHAPEPRCLHDAFEYHAREQPDAVAIVWGTSDVTYGELDRRARALANRLRHLGVGPETRVGLFVERSPDLVVAMLAIVMTGAAYVPLDPNYPADRLAFMVEDAGVRVAVIGAREPGFVVDHTLRVAGDDAAIAPVACVDPRNAAYVMYTSGSTGRPKGVVIEHAAAAAYTHHFADHVLAGRMTGTLASSSISFDTSVEEIFATLSAGGSLVLADRVFDLAELPRAVTIVETVPSAMTELLDARNLPITVRTVILGGERTTNELVQRIYALDHVDDVIDLYGPTETTISATYARRDRGIDAPETIGRPLLGARAYVLDRHAQQVPLGAIGELHVGGPRLARGYHGRPDLTARAFLPDPYTDEPGARMYRTGDLVRLRSDATLEFLGRIDDQIKLRGVRIEPGEIEAVLRGVSGVLACAVAVRDHAAGPSLVAYVAASGQVTVEHLRAHAIERLPEGMVPTRFVQLAALPLLPSGKLDRAALAALPLPDDSAARDTHAPPVSTDEIELARLWSSLLGVARVGQDDHFFRLGGHSLLAARLVSRIRQIFDVELPLRRVFDAPTLRGLAAAIRSERPVTIETRAIRELSQLVSTMSEDEAAAQLDTWSQVALVPEVVASELTGPWRHLLERLVAQHRIDQSFSAPLAPRTQRCAPITLSQRQIWDFHQRGNFPALCSQATAFALKGRLDVCALRSAITGLVERQTALRTVFAVVDGRVVQTIRDRKPTIDVIDVSTLDPDAREARCRELFAEISEPHDLAREVFRARVVGVGPDEYLMFLAPSHIVCDGFSWAAVVADLVALYRGFSTGVDPALPALAYQFADFAFWQVTLEDRPLGKAELAFWANAVAGYEGLVVPCDRQQVKRDSVGLALDTYERGAIPFAILDDDWAGVTRLCIDESCTPYAVLAAAWFVLLTRWSGRSDACVLSANGQFERSGSAAIVGDSSTAYPLRMRVDSAVTLREHLRRCQAAVIAFREHGHVAPTSTVSAFREWSRYSLNYTIGDPDRAFDLGEVTVEQLDWSVHRQLTPHDLALFVCQTEDGLRGNLVFNAEQFSPALAARATEWLARIVGMLVRGPDAIVGDLPTTPD